MKKSLLAAAPAAVLFVSVPVQAEGLMGDVKLAYEAILCLSASTRSTECNELLRRYFSIKHRKAHRTTRARHDFLKQCPRGQGGDAAVERLVKRRMLWPVLHCFFPCIRNPPSPGETAHPFLCGLCPSLSAGLFLQRGGCLKRGGRFLLCESSGGRFGSHYILKPINQQENLNMKEVNLAMQNRGGYNKTLYCVSYTQYAAVRAANQVEVYCTATILARIAVR